MRKLFRIRQAKPSICHLHARALTAFRDPTVQGHLVHITNAACSHSGGDGPKVAVGQTKCLIMRRKGAQEIEEVHSVHLIMAAGQTRKSALPRGLVFGEEEKSTAERRRSPFCLALRPAALGQSQGSVKRFSGSSAGWWADTTATLLPGKKDIARGTSEKIDTEPLGQT